MVDVQTTNRVLKVAAVLLLLVAVALAFIAVRSPASSAVSGNEVIAGHPFASAPIVAAPLLDEFAGQWDKRMQVPVIEPPPPPPKDRPQTSSIRPQPSPAEQVQVKLVGTILESGRSQAIFVGPGGKIDLKGVGQDLELAPQGVRVEEIQLASVTLSYRGEKLTLRLLRAEVR